MNDGDFIILDPRGTSRTISRPVGHTMYVRDVDSATATTFARNDTIAIFHGSSIWTIYGSSS